MNTTRFSALALAAVLAASIANAQPPSPPPGPQDDHRWDPAAMREHREAHEAAHLKALHDVLAIRPDQEAAFQAFAASMHPRGGPGMDGRREPGAGWKDDQAAQAPMTAPERLDAQLKRFDERTAHMREALTQRATALKTFYAALSPEQKRTLDALPQLMGHGEHGGFGGRGPHGPAMMTPDRPGAGE